MEQDSVEHEWTTSAGRVEKEAVKKKFNKAGRCL